MSDTSDQPLMLAGKAYSRITSYNVCYTKLLRQRPDAVSVARGFVEGNPGIIQIQERASADPEDIVQAVAAATENVYGPAPLQIPLREFVFLARRP